ncbi:Retrovirus-related Pol polyprotein from transposon TNT 1-94 [Cucumis melo var. makuwa]|uniref:Retrovirus-related Pol polyprotein from transposon TNT 1-94 n=1 Tax=Cucumis melo var. makuwa TaxID=1194695 RepID=A0A5D3CI97_CUCMM|nr:Retrovirus-related Pol polyprotein from transposon TNT 1-94 [Cucumis melo var. makuwa]TYK11022.1 Retrovirus-related Pol polyprotein from transposon TNT 1-94 [Cucumis melo var. makuwa]
MDQSKSLEENLKEFQKIVVDVNNIDEKMSNENQAVILLNSLLSETYQEVKAAIKYGRDSLTMNIVLDAVKTRNLEIKKEHKDGELLMARGRSDKKSWKGKEKSFMMNSKGETRKYDSVEVLMVSHRDIRDAWIIDLECTFHMTPN